jgi:hypothetical protein
LSKLQTNEDEDALLKLGRGDAEDDGDEDALLLAVEERTRPAAARSSWTTRTARDAGLHRARTSLSRTSTHAMKSKPKTRTRTRTRKQSSRTNARK